MTRDTAWVRHLYDRLLNGIRAKIPHVYINGDENQRYWGNLK